MDWMREGLYPEGSITRRVNRENVLILGGGRALLMQLAHPMVAAGVDEHSDFRQRPMYRLRRTIRLTMAIVFGDRETALAAARAPAAPGPGDDPIRGGDRGFAASGAARAVRAQLVGAAGAPVSPHGHRHPPAGGGHAACASRLAAARPQCEPGAGSFAQRMR